MNLYIQLENGQPINHPIMEENLRQAFPEMDLNNLPETFARFERVPVTVPGVYEVNEGLTYEWVDGIVKDVHHVRAMTEEERTAKQDQVKNAWQQNNGSASWTFNEETCTFDPPSPYPTDGKFYVWDEPTTSWVEITDESPAARVGNTINT
jgi:hypothetical protein